MTNGGPEPQLDGDAADRRSRAVCQGFLVRESECAALAGAERQQPDINIKINVEAAPTRETDFEVTLRLEGKAEAQGMLLFGFELILCRRVPHPQRAAGQFAADRA